ncbi:MAG: c-type cytochrome [Wenzhouxiangellaceae bacterium]
MSEQDDKIFLQRFSLVLVGLILFALAMFALALQMHGSLVGSENPARDAAKLARIQPVFDVYAGATGRAAAMASAEQENADQPAQVAFGGSLDGEMIYTNACQACHMAGAAGAPQLVAAQWEGRLEQGVDTLVDHAINGIGVMPAKGGRSDLSDEQVRASVEYMLDQLE